MSTKVDDVARAVLSDLSSNAGLLLAVNWCSQRYRELSNKIKFRHLRQLGEYTIPAPITAGTCTATRNDTTIVGNATARTAWLATDLKSGHWYVRVRRGWYKIVNQNASGDLQLEAPFGEDTVSDVDYTVIRRFHSLTTRAPIRKLGKFTHQRLNISLTDMSHRALDMEDPSRWLVAGYGPQAVCEVNDDPEGRRVVEFHPFSSREEHISFVYWPISPDLRLGTVLPAELDTNVLKVGVLVDAYRFEMMRAMREGKNDAAALMANLHRSQETKWQDTLAEAAAADVGLDDAHVILHPQGPPAQTSNPLIKTGRDDALSRLSNWP